MCAWNTGGGKQRKRDREGDRLRTPLGQNGARLYSAATAKCILLLNPSPLPLLLFLSHSISLEFTFFLLPLSAILSPPALSLPLSPFTLSPSTGPGIPSCGCKIDGASRDNCCSGTRFQTRVHLEYTWRKALPIVEGARREEKRARSDFSFVKRFFGHDTVCYRSPIYSFARSRIRRVLQEISRIRQECFSRRTTVRCWPASNMLQLAQVLEMQLYYALFNGRRKQNS